MTIYRNVKDNQLYLLYRESPRAYTGSWIVAQRYFPHCDYGPVKTVPATQIKNYVPVGVR
jgi:hypothetical protein